MANPMKSPKTSKRVRKLRVSAEKVASGARGRADRDDPPPTPPSMRLMGDEFTPPGSVDLMLGAYDEVIGRITTRYTFGNHDGQAATAAFAPWYVAPS